MKNGINRYMFTALIALATLVPMNSLAEDTLLTWWQPTDTTMASPDHWEYGIALSEGQLIPFTKLDANLVLEDEKGRGQIWSAMVPELPAGAYRVIIACRDAACTPLPVLSNMIAAPPTDPGTCERADLNDDGTVGFPDYMMLIQWFLKQCGENAEPESRQGSS